MSDPGNHRLPHRVLEAGVLIGARLERVVEHLTRSTDEDIETGFLIRGAVATKLITLIIGRMFRDDILRFDGIPKHRGHMVDVINIAKSVEERLARDFQGGFIAFQDLTRLVEIVLFRFMLKQHLIIRGHALNSTKDSRLFFMRAANASPS